ncbi:MAG: rhodanese-like domain-containing protein [Deltaproteobacteria bacterium]|nr:rhodanese-like domain-containing protein [Deltaproteobacteria bacterium]
MPITQLTPLEAKDLLDQNPDALYVDVRSIPEFSRGHPKGALNIPLNHLNEQKRQMQANPDFLKVTQAHLPKDKLLIIGCQAGGRSQQACNFLEEAGYTQLYNMMGGFGGGRNFETGEPVQGWAAEGLPVSTENGEGIGYESLVKKVSPSPVEGEGVFQSTSGLNIT